MESQRFLCFSVATKPVFFNSLKAAVTYIGLLNIFVYAFNIYSYSEPMMMYPYLDSFSKTVVPLYLFNHIVVILVALLSITAVYMLNLRLSKLAYKLSVLNAVLSPIMFSVVFRSEL